MKNLQKKLDQQKAALDREQLWQRIEKPEKRDRKGFIYLGGGTLVILLLGMALWMILPNEWRSSTSIASMPEATVLHSIDTQQISPDYKIDHRITIAPKSTTNTTQSSADPSTKSYRNIVPPQHSNFNKKLLPTDQVATKTSSSIEEENIQKTKTQSSTVPTETIQTVLPSTSSPSTISQTTTSWAVSPSITSLSSEELFFKRPPLLLNTALITASLKSRKTNRLAIKFGVGIHQNDFSSRSLTTQAAIRSDLEKDNNNFQLGLQYEKGLARGYYLFALAQYTVIQDHIDTRLTESSYLLNAFQLSQQTTTTRYQLYNRYELLDLVIGAGKELGWGDWSLDLSAGIGFNSFQQAQGNYFDENLELVEINHNDQYDNSRTIFGLLDLGIRKSLGRHRYLKGGLQLQSKRRLSRAMNPLQHQVRPMHFYIQLGQRF